MFPVSFIRSHSLWRQELFCLFLVFRRWTCSASSADDSGQFGLSPLRGSQQVQLFSIPHSFSIDFLVCLPDCSKAKASPTWCRSSGSSLVFTDHIKTAKACSNLLAPSPSRPRLHIPLHTQHCKTHHDMVVEFQVGYDPVCRKNNSFCVSCLSLSLKSLLSSPFLRGILQLTEQSWQREECKYRLHHIQHEKEYS